MLKKDYQILESALNLKSDVKVAIISDEYILSSNNGFLYHDGIVLCNSGAFKNGKYKTALTGAYMKTTETWKQVAATHYYFNKGASVDISKLKDYYVQNEDDLLLTLFHGYFNASFDSNEVIDIADMTAVGLGEYIIDNYSFDAFLNISFLLLSFLLKIYFSFSGCSMRMFSMLPHSTQVSQRTFKCLRISFFSSHCGINSAIHVPAIK